jgi:hypothetical protein
VVTDRDRANSSATSRIFAMRFDGTAPPWGRFTIRLCYK